jgi:hypothetical protein
MLFHSHPALRPEPGPAILGGIRHPQPLGWNFRRQRYRRRRRRRFKVLAPPAHAVISLIPVALIGIAWAI